MSTVLDMIGAMLIGGVLMLITNRAIDHGARQYINANGDAIIQAELSTMTRIIQSDLRKAGYGISESDQAVIMQKIDSDHFSCLTRLTPGNGVPDTIEYVVAIADSFVIVDASIVFYSIDRIFKSAGEDPVVTRVGNVTNSEVFRYLDQSGAKTAIKQAVDMVEVTLIAVNPAIYLNDQILAATTTAIRKKELKKLAKESFWRQTRVVSRNLRR